MKAVEYECLVVSCGNIIICGYATKDDYTAALRAYQAYLAEVKSSQRDKAAAADANYRYY